MGEEPDLYADTPASRAAWERACRDAVQEDLEREASRETRLMSAVWVLPVVRLEGSYPDTRLVVVHTDVRTGDERAMRFELWRPELLFISEDGKDRSPPWFVRDMIFSHVIDS